MRRETLLRGLYGRWLWWEREAEERGLDAVLEEIYAERVRDTGRAVGLDV